MLLTRESDCLLPGLAERLTARLVTPDLARLRVDHNDVFRVADLVAKEALVLGDLG